MNSSEIKIKNFMLLFSLIIVLMLDRTSRFSCFPGGALYALTLDSVLITIPPSPFPLPPGERDFESPSLDGRGSGEGD